MLLSLLLARRAKTRTKYEYISTALICKKIMKTKFNALMTNNLFRKKAREAESIAKTEREIDRREMAAFLLPRTAKSLQNAAGFSRKA